MRPRPCVAALSKAANPDASALPDALQYTPAYLTDDQASRLLDVLSADLPWTLANIKLFGRTHRQPRLICWMGDASYRYSGRTWPPSAWHPAVKTLRNQLALDCGVDFNSVLINLYRNGQDCMGWHADDEPELGPQPVIASISLGAARDFRLRRKDRSTAPFNLRLAHGSLLCMGGDTQAHWQHSLPRRTRVTTPRINLTFRRVLAQPATKVA